VAPERHLQTASATPPQIFVRQNFRFIQDNRSFYNIKLRAMKEKCRAGGFRIQCGGSLCDRNTVGYVRHVLGVVVEVVVICPEFYRDRDDGKTQTMYHEFGRLLQIGDEDKTTNDINQWDLFIKELSRYYNVINPGYDSYSAVRMNREFRRNQLERDNTIMRPDYLQRAREELGDDTWPEFEKILRDLKR
jgi:hypothetical protein